MGICVSAHKLANVENIPPQWDVNHRSCRQNSKQGPPVSDAKCNPGQSHVTNAIKQEGPKRCEENSHGFTQHLRTCARQNPDKHE